MPRPGTAGNRQANNASLSDLDLGHERRQRHTAVFARLNALTELLGPAWCEAINARYGIAALESSPVTPTPTR
jgi:hypothetical protein